MSDPLTQYSQKMRGFIEKLLSNDNLKNEPLPAAEEHVRLFVKSNIEQIAQTFRTPDFFPDLPPADSLKLFQTMLSGIAVEKTEAFLEEKVFPVLDFGFIRRFSQILPEKEEVLSKLRSLMGLILKNHDIRKQSQSLWNIFEYDMIGRYICAAYNRKEYLYNEMYKVSRHSFTMKESKGLLQMIALLNLIMYLPIPLDNEKTVKGNFYTPGLTNVQQSKYIETIIQFLKGKLKIIPEIVFQYSVYSHGDTSNTKLEYSFSRIAAVLTRRGMDVVRVRKMDKGADAPDKSWFNTVRMNYKLYHFDQKLIEEFYKIAADENW